MSRTFPLRHTPRQPWTPLSDSAFHALLPFILAPRSPRGRQVTDLRTRLDAIFYIATTADPWRALPARFGRPDTIARYFRRLTHAGLWQDLLNYLARVPHTDPLRAIEHLITRACRRAARLCGLGLVILIRRLGLVSALPGPPGQVANPILSETIARFPITPLRRLTEAAIAATRVRIALLRHLHRGAGGVQRLPRASRLAWS
jgi:transposase